MKIDAVLTAERYSETGSAKNIVRDKLVVDMFIARIGRPAAALGDILHPVNLADTRMRTAPLRRSEPGQHLRREALRERHTAQRRRLCAHGFNRRLDLVLCNASIRIERKVLDAADDAIRLGCARIEEFVKRHLCVLKEIVSPGNR